MTGTDGCEEREYIGENRCVEVQYTVKPKVSEHKLQVNFNTEDVFTFSFYQYSIK